MLGGAKAVGNQLHRCVDEESHKHARRHDFHVRTLLLVEVPGATRSEEIAAQSGAVHDDYEQVEHL